MKAELKLAVALLLLFSLYFQVGIGYAQGDLTPTSAPAPMMKTLAQIEPRISVQSLGAAPPYTITQAGSYYLTGNITVGSGNAVNINVANVSLDLMGFTIESTNATAGGAAINAGAVSRLRLSNGNIQSGTTVTNGALTARGFAYGVQGTNLNDSAICDLQVTGVSATCIASGDNCKVERCRVSSSNVGISNPGSGLTKHCLAANCANSGIIGGDLVEGCAGYGFYTQGISGRVVSFSRGGTQTGTGLIATVSAQNCWGYSGVSTGMDCTGATASGCKAETVGGSYSLKAAIAIGCVISGGSPVIGNRYNMP
jgi:hypothetical protein